MLTNCRFGKQPLDQFSPKQQKAPDLDLLLSQDEAVVAGVQKLEIPEFAKHRLSDGILLKT